MSARILSDTSRFLTLLLCVVLMLTVSTPWVHAQKGALTYPQLEHLVKLPAPDSLVASQIRSRGVSFTVTSTTIEKLKSAGAGSETLAALRDAIHMGTLQIDSEPGGAVSIDGKSVGIIASDGTLVLPHVSAGDHQVSVLKVGFKENSAHISIGNRETKRVTMQLEWAGGYLSIAVAPQNAKVSVTGPKSFEGLVSDSQCPPGNYTASVSTEGYISQTRTFQIAAGEHHRETFELVADPAIVAEKLGTARRRLAAGDFVSALQFANAVLTQMPGNSDAALIVAEAAFQTGDINRFVDAGTKAIRGGKPVTVPVMHVHMGWILSIHPVDLTISEAGIAVVSNPPDSHCKAPASLDFDLIQSMSVQRDPRGFPELHVQFASKPHGAILHDLDMVPRASMTGTTAAPGQVFGAATIHVSQNALQTLDGIQRLIVRAKR